MGCTGFGIGVGILAPPLPLIAKAYVGTIWIFFFGRKMLLQ